MRKTALILFAHGSRDPGWAAPLHRVRAAVLDRTPSARIELAFLEFIAPTLQESAATLVAEGVEHVVIVPMFIAQGGHLKNDLPVLIDELRQRYRDVAFDLSGPVGEVDSVVMAMADYVSALSTER